MFSFQLEKDCPFYMRTGSCAYGVNCRYHHPDPVAAGGSDHFNGNPIEVFLAGHSSGNHDCLQLKEASEPAVESWSSNTVLHKTIPYMDNHSSHVHWMHL